MGLSVKKQWLRVGGEPLFVCVLKRLMKFYAFSQIIVVGHKNEIQYMQNFVSENVQLVAGGNTRQQSIQNAISNIKSEFVCIHDVARANITKKVFSRLLKGLSVGENIACVVPFLSVPDTVFYRGEYLKRDDIKLIQTPQISQTALLQNAINSSTNFTDESSLLHSLGEEVVYVKGSKKLHKITYAKDLAMVKKLNKNHSSIATTTRYGFGLDIHAFEESKPMILGGARLPCEYGCKAHSDGDVLIHSLIDAMLGAVGAGDIGEFFPDNDEQYKNADSAVFLQKIHTFINNIGFELVNIDVTVLAEKPKINPHKNEIKQSLAKLLQIQKHQINIKATTNEKMGYVGREEGIGVYCVVGVREIEA